MSTSWNSACCIRTAIARLFASGSSGLGSRNKFLIYKDSVEGPFCFPGLGGGAEGSTTSCWRRLNTDHSSLGILTSVRDDLSLPTWVMYSGQTETGIPQIRRSIFGRRQRFHAIPRTTLVEPTHKKTEKTAKRARTMTKWQIKYSRENGANRNRF